MHKASSLKISFLQPEKTNGQIKENVRVIMLEFMEHCLGVQELS